MPGFVNGTYGQWQGFTFFVRTKRIVTIDRSATSRKKCNTTRERTLQDKTTGTTDPIKDHFHRASHSSLLKIKGEQTPNKTARSTLHHPEFFSSHRPPVR
jgi:hypothetical protein